LELDDEPIARGREPIRKGQVREKEAQKVGGVNVLSNVRSRMALARRFSVLNSFAMGVICVPLVGGGHGCRTCGTPPVQRTQALRGMTVAVAPAINASGSNDFEPSRFAEAMAVELGQIDGMAVVPMSRVFAALASRNKIEVATPADVRDLAKMLGVNFVLVFAVTHYDPYEPPKIGISAELYATGQRLDEEGKGVMPGDSETRGFSKASSSANKEGVRSQVTRVFDASRASVLDDLKSYAKQRSAGNSPYEWRQFVVCQQNFIEYCCNATVRAIIQDCDRGWFAGNAGLGVGMP